MGGTCAVREEPGKQKQRSALFASRTIWRGCRAQELARSCAQKNARQKKAGFAGPGDIGERSEGSLRRVTVVEGKV